MKVTSLSVLLLVVVSVSPAIAQTSTLTVTAVNKLKTARPSETIELTAETLAPLAEKDLTKIHVRDGAGREVLAQAVDTDYDDLHKPDTLIFQADFGPNETKTFTLSAGAKRVYTKEDFRAYGRFVRERFDDFAWENDRIAHRTYGKALITWKGEPLTSSAIDIWSKRTTKMVINDWYMVDNYHADHGEGADGMQGLAVVVDPRAVDKLAEDKLNHLVILKPGIARPVTYWAGFAWDRAGHITSAESWKAYVDQFAERLRSPIDLSIK